MDRQRSQAMGRRRVEIKRIENGTSRQVTFSKRRGGLLKKASELAVLCDAQVGVVIFSSRGKLFEYCSPPYSLRELIHRYETTNNTQLQEINHEDQQMLTEIARLKHESEQLESTLRRYTGEDLSSVATVDELNELLQQLELAITKVRERKHELLNQQLDDLRRQEHILEDQNSFLCRMINENGQHPAVAETRAVAAGVKMEGMPPMPMPMPMLPPTAFGHFFPEVEDASTSSTALQLWPQLHDDVVQPTQPNLQVPPCLTGHGLRLW